MACVDEWRTALIVTCNEVINVCLGLEAGPVMVYTSEALLALSITNPLIRLIDLDNQKTSFKYYVW